MRALMMAALLAAASTSHAAGVYFCMVDGVKTFTDKPCEGTVKLYDRATSDKPKPVAAAPEATPAATAAAPVAPQPQVIQQALPSGPKPPTEYDMKWAANQSKLINGMTPNWVERAWGAPDGKKAWATDTGIAERWQWDNARGEVVKEAILINGTVSSFYER